MSRFALMPFLRFRAAVFTAATLSMLVLAGCDQIGGDTDTSVPTRGAQAWPTKTPGDKLKPQPADFRVSYEWRAGSMPPPYHYEYSIRIGPGTQGQIVYRPDYHSDRVPTWTEAIMVTNQQLSDLYALVLDRKLLRENWGKVLDPPVGGSMHWAEIIADGKTYKIPSELQGFQQDSAEKLYEAVKALVPKETWSKLEAQREQYVEDYKNKNED